jgi:glycosyltransferase involved in cell wall biosynthesis
VLGKYLQDFNKLPGQRIVSHVHELLPSLLQLSNHTLVKTQLALSDSVIACAPCVANSLIQNFQLSRSKCQIIPEYINPATIAGLSENASKAKAGIKTKLDSKELEKMEQAIRRGAHVFGVGGNAIHRKGFDLFPLLVKECKQRFGPIPFHAVWIGCSEGSPGHVDLAWDLCHMGLEDCVSLIPNVPMDTFRLILRQFQVLTLLSREDPFPLVVLEAGLLEVPTVCFQGSGAIPDLADNQCCIAVDYLDLSAFAAAVHRLCLAPEERHQIGSRCRRLVEDELSLAKVGPRVAEILFGENVP